MKGSNDAPVPIIRVVERFEYRAILTIILRFERSQLGVV